METEEGNFDGRVEGVSIRLLVADTNSHEADTDSVMTVWIATKLGFSVITLCRQKCAESS